MSRFRMRTVAALGVAVGWLLLLAAPAQAHVLLDSVTPRGDGTVDLVFTFDHGCSKQEPTDELTMQIPDHTAVLSATEPQGWTHRIEDGTIHWTGPGIPDGRRAAFGVTARVGATAGETVLFPTVQACAGAEPYAWTGRADGDDYPAPRFVATSATVDASLLEPPASATSSGAGPWTIALAIVAFVVGVGVVTRWRGSAR